MKAPAALILVAGLALLAPLEAYAAADLCKLPQRFVVSGEAMPGLAQQLGPEGNLVILAIGSARSFEPDAGQPPLGFPSRMLAALRAAVPEAHLSMLLEGGRGLSARAMLPILRRTLRAAKIGLVIWQTGTVEAVRDSPPEDFLAALADGVSIVQRAGAALILVDPQFSRFLRTNTNIDAYLPAFREVAIEPDVTLFPRFALTHYWVDQGSFDLEAAPASTVPALARAMQDCVGRALARFVLSSAGKAKAPLR